jgi:hypothetical protein
MLRSLRHWWLTSPPVRFVHRLSERLHGAYFEEFDPFNDAAAR